MGSGIETILIQTTIPWGPGSNQYLMSTTPLQGSPRARASTPESSTRCQRSKRCRAHRAWEIGTFDTDGLWHGAPVEKKGRGRGRRGGGGGRKFYWMSNKNNYQPTVCIYIHIHTHKKREKKKVSNKYHYQLTAEARVRACSESLRRRARTQEETLDIHIQVSNF